MGMLVGLGSGSVFNQGQPGTTIILAPRLNWDQVKLGSRSDWDLGETGNRVGLCLGSAWDQGLNWNQVGLGVGSVFDHGESETGVQIGTRVGLGPGSGLNLSLFSLHSDATFRQGLVPVLRPGAGHVAS